MSVVWRWFAYFTDPMSVFLWLPWRVQQRRAANNHSSDTRCSGVCFCSFWLVSGSFHHGYCSSSLFSWSALSKISPLHLDSVCIQQTLCVKSLVAQSAAVDEPECRIWPFLAFLAFLASVSTISHISNVFRSESLLHMSAVWVPLYQSK